MATLKLLILSMIYLRANAVPHQPLVRNTIFGDEKLEGEIFEHFDDYQNISLFDATVEAYRLPTTTRPIHYNVRWTIDIGRLAYEGEVTIQLAATEPGVSEIVIHSDHTAIMSLVLSQGTTVIPQTYTTDAVHQFIRIRPSSDLLFNELSPIVYSLTITFGASMRTDMYGIYQSWYRNTYTDQERWMATTQFQATSARYAFPCYDEPSFKATFDITIRRPTAFRSWSNTRIRETVNATTGYQDDIYHTTPIISTYLLALIVAEYNSMEEFDSNGNLIYEVIARPSAIESGQGQYAFDVGQQLLASMSEHTDLDFFSMNPNLKMTQASIPDFSAGAMENWGLLTYREAYLMYDEQNTNGYFKQLIAYILSHEIAHMWFGNLVTCDWWDVTWLNEGFARYYQYFLTHWVEDYMGLDTRFITEQVHASLLSDSSNNPQPLTNPGVGSPASVSAMFSTITYNKGAAVIRMTEHLLGTNVHRAGLRNYLVEFSFRAVQPIDLFTSLQTAGNAAGALTEYGSGFDFIEYYKTWTEQGGHPVLNVQVNHQTGDMIITQRRFNINSGYSAVNSKWIVPITFSTASNPDFVNTKPSHIISDTVTVINRGSIGDEWVIFNKQQTGYYRVNYDDYTWDLIIIALRGQDRTRIHEYNRAQIVNDVFQFARSGLMTYTRAFNILSFLEFETEYAPWVAAMTGFSWIRNRLAGSPNLVPLEAMIARWANTVMNQLTYYPIEGESFMRSYLRYQLAPVMCAIGNTACLAAANEQFGLLVSSNTYNVPVDSRNWVYCNGLRQGTEASFNFLWERYQQHNVYTEKILLLQNLGCTPHANSLNRFLDAIVQENYEIRRQDYTSAFNSAATGNEGNTQIVFQYIQNNLQNVIQAFGNAATPLSYVSSRLRTEAQIDSFVAWAVQNQANLGGSYQAVINGAESSRQSIQWAATVADDMNTYLVNGNDNIGTTTPAIVTDAPMTTASRPDLVEPVTPDLTDSTDSAVTTCVSALVLTSAIAANYLL